MKKNKIIALSTLAAAGVLGMGAFAFFSDHTDQSTDGTIGTVDIDKGEDLELGNAGNFNPGDENPDPNDPYAPSTSHPLTFSMENKGTKSVITRNIIDITVKGAFASDEEGNLLRKNEEGKTDGPFIPVDEYMAEHEEYNPYLNPTVFDLYVKQNGKNVAIENAGFGASRFTYTVKEEGTEKDITILRYIIPGAVLDGTGGEAPEIGDASASDPDKGMTVTDGTKVEYEYYLGMKKDTTDSYQGAAIKVDLYVQAMQNRNTDKGDNGAGNGADAGDWETVFSDTVTSGD